MQQAHWSARAARAFYRQALRGRPLRPTGRNSTAETLAFAVGDTIIEVDPTLGAAAAPLRLEVDDPHTIAERCWNAGFTVRLGQDETGHAPLSVIDPFGRRVDLVPQTAPGRSSRDTSRERP